MDEIDNIEQAVYVIAEGVDALPDGSETKTRAMEALDWVCEAEFGCSLVDFLRTVNQVVADFEAD